MGSVDLFLRQDRFGSGAEDDDDKLLPLLLLPNLNSTSSIVGSVASSIEGAAVIPMVSELISVFQLFSFSAGGGSGAGKQKLKLQGVSMIFKKGKGWKAR